MLPWVHSIVLHPLYQHISSKYVQISSHCEPAEPSPLKTFVLPRISQNVQTGNTVPSSRHISPYSKLWSRKPFPAQGERNVPCTGPVLSFFLFSALWTWFLPCRPKNVLQFLWMPHQQLLLWVHRLWHLCLHAALSWCIYSTINNSAQFLCSTCDTKHWHKMPEKTPGTLPVETFSLLCFPLLICIPLASMGSEGMPPRTTWNSPGWWSSWLHLFKQPLHNSFTTCFLWSFWSS